MLEQSPTTEISLQALLLADHIYCDQGSGKYVIAGAFSQLNVPTFPTTFARTIGVFVSILGLTGTTRLDLEFVDVSNGEVLVRTKALELFCGDPRLPVEFALEVPPLPLPHAGSYHFRLLANDIFLGATVVIVRALPDDG